MGSHPTSQCSVFTYFCHFRQSSIKWSGDSDSNASQENGCFGCAIYRQIKTITAAVSVAKLVYKTSFYYFDI